MNLSKLFWSFLYLPNNFFIDNIAEKQKRVWLIVNAFYIFNLYFAFDLFTEQLPKYESPPDSYLWPIFWMSFLDFDRGRILLGIPYLVFSVLVLVDVRSLFLRSALFLCTLSICSLTQSYVKISHDWHVMLFVLFGLCFLSRRKVHRNLAVFFCTQALILFTYSLSGFWKYAAGLFQFFFDSVSIFDANAILYKVSYEMIARDIIPILSSWIFEFPWFFNILLIFAIYLELYSLYIVFQPKLHRVWGFWLILMHIGTYFCLGVSFAIPIIYLGLFFLLSPFQEKFRLPTLIFHFPWIGLLLLAINDAVKLNSNIEIYHQKRQKKLLMSCLNISNIGKRASVQESAVPSVGENLVRIKITQENDCFVLKNSEALLFLLLRSKISYLAVLALILPSLFYDLVLMGLYFIKDIFSKAENRF